MDEILASLETGLTTIKADATSAIAKAVGLGIPIMGLLFAVRAGIKAFKSVSR